MKAKLEAIANVTVILVALGVGYMVLARYVTAYRARPVAAGDRLAAIPNLDWKQHRHTLVLALNTGCHFCEQSVPLYQRLADAKEPGSDVLDLVAVFPNDPDTVRQFMVRENLRIRSVSGVSLEKLKVVGTPTLILIDDQGRVAKSWVGMLEAPEEADLLSRVSALSAGCATGGPSSLVARRQNDCSSGTKEQIRRN